MSPRPAPPVFIIHGLSHGRAALHAAQGRALILLSPAGAAGLQGVTWWLRLLAQLRQEFPDNAMIGALDCADCCGWALAALRLGVDRVILNGSGPAFWAVQRAAEQKGAWGEGRWGSDAHDLLGFSDPGLTCRDIFERGPSV